MNNSVFLLKITTVDVLPYFVDSKSAIQYRTDFAADKSINKNSSKIYVYFLYSNFKNVELKIS